MTEPRQIPAIQPRLLRRERAAAYIDVSTSHFDKLVKSGSLPPSKVLGTMKWWDRADLDSFADNLPYDQIAIPDTSWDD